MGVFRKDGEYWTLQFDGTVVHVRDTRGLRYVAHLLASPDQPLAASELANAIRAVERAAGEADLARSSAEASPQIGPTAESRLEAAERARSAVTKRIKDAIRKIEVCHPVLGRHLERTVKTGLACVYRPDPDRPTHWVLS